MVFHLNAVTTGKKQEPNMPQLRFSVFTSSEVSKLAETNTASVNSWTKIRIQAGDKDAAPCAASPDTAQRACDIDFESRQTKNSDGRAARDMM